MNSVEHMFWCESYRPQTIDDCILPKQTKQMMEAFIAKGEIPNLLLHGPAGSGKTTAAKVLCNALNYDYIIINGSDEGRLLDTLRTKITQFASTVSFEGKRKCVIIDEADYIPADPQAALRNFTETFSSNCSFIFTCNFVNRISEPLHSRCAVVDYTIPNAEVKELTLGICKRTFAILDQEQIAYDKKVVATVVQKFFPDFRRTINELQRYSATGKIDAGMLVSADETELATLFQILKDKNFKELRKFVASTPNLELTALSRKLYDKAYDLMTPDSIPQLTLDIADYQYKASFVADAEIHLVAFLTVVMSNCAFK